MANLYGTIQVMEDQIREEYQRFRNDVTFLQDSARIGELEKNVAKLHNIVKEALSAEKFHGWSTGQKAFLETTLHDAKLYIIDHLKNLIQEFKSLKADLTFHAYFSLNNGKRSLKHFRIPYQSFLRTTSVEQWFDQGIKIILERMHDFNEMESGWALEEIVDIKTNIVKTNPIRGSSFIPTPEFIRKKNAVVNIRCKRNDCFACSVVAALKPCIKRGSRQNERSSYPTWRHMLINFGDIAFPVSLEDIPEFERLNPKICVYVYQCDEEKEQVYLVYESENKKKKSPDLQKVVRLLLLEKDGKMHYCTIRDMSRLIYRQVGDHHGKKYLCDTCQQCFQSQEKLDRHSDNCAAINKEPVLLPSEDEKFLKFTEYHKKEPLPCILYLDLECFLQECGEKDHISSDSDEDYDMNEQICTTDFMADECDEEHEHDEWYDLEEFRLEKKTHLERAAYRRHLPYSLGYYYLHRYDESKCYYKRHRGRYCIRNFARDLERLAQDIEHEIDNPVPIKMTEQDKKDYESTNICHFCEREIVDPSDKVADHNHRGEGAYRGVADRLCNLRCVDPPTVVIAIHNSAMYDTHLLIRDICNVIPGKVENIFQDETGRKFATSMGSMEHQDPQKLQTLSSDPKERPAILLFIDLQGFKNQEEFIVKEAMIVDVNSTNCHQWLFTPPYSIKNLSQKDEISAKWCTEHHHGLFWDQGIVPYSEAGEKFEESLSATCNPRDGRPIFIFVTGNEKERWLKQLAPTFFSTHPDIEVIDIYDELPGSEYNYNSLNYQFEPCVFHDNMRYRCALRTESKMSVDYTYAPMAIEEIPLNRWLPVTKFKPFGDDKITMILEDKVQIILPKNVTYWARYNREEFLKLQDEARNSMLFIVAEKNVAHDFRVHFKRVSDSLLFAWERSEEEDSDDETDSS
ncbi:hypothetical protein QAD02_002307 [Eretmocerus hayati]|uniref:Uncharacterized protein n=1 Tax=Eretmocerus hayati TaxID=131215 RepID=A0ACC2NIN3_9HYME|nr:hypothetical protein QAD02_002307 [Eretmocerus hayati]